MRRVACNFRLTAFCVGSRRVAATPGRYRPSGPQKPGEAIADAFVEKMSIVPRSPVVVPLKWLRNSGVESPQQKGGLAMDTRALDRLGDEIAELSAHLDAATARLLDLIREFDVREGWNTGFRSCAAWLSWRVGLDPGAARERVRVARALETLPRLAQALARGELSYAKVRALTRVATPETEERLLAVGRAGTADHVERIVRGWRRVDRKAEAREAAQRHASRALHVYQDEDSMVILRGRLAPEVGAVLMQALAAARETLYQRALSQDGDAGPVDVSYETVPASRRFVHEYDVVAELFETADVVTADARGVAALEVVGPEVMVGDPALEHVPESHDHRVLDGDDSFLRTATPLNAVIERAVVALLRADGRPGDLLQRRAQPGRALAGGGGLPLSRTLVGARTEPRPGGQVRRRGKRLHVHARFREDRLGGADGDAGHGLRQRCGLGERRHGLLDSGIQRDDMGLQRIDERQMLLEQEGVVWGEAAHERLAERGALLT